MKDFFGFFQMIHEWLPLIIIVYPSGVVFIILLRRWLIPRKSNWRMMEIQSSQIKQIFEVSFYWILIIGYYLYYIISNQMVDELSSKIEISMQKTPYTYESLYKDFGITYSKEQFDEALKTLQKKKVIQIDSNILCNNCDIIDSDKKYVVVTIISKIN